MAEMGTLGRSLLGNGVVLTDDAIIRYGPDPNSGKTITAVGGRLKYTGLIPVLASTEDGLLLTQRHRVTLAEMNTGHTLLGAVPAMGYRLVNVMVIAIGGAAAATADATGLALYGTQDSSEVALYTALLAALTEDAVCTINTTNTSVLAAGASFAVCDDNTSLTVKAVSAGTYDLITAESFDVILTYALEA
jgi:hypothetical protein